MSSIKSNEKTEAAICQRLDFDLLSRRFPEVNYKGARRTHNTLARATKPNALLFTKSAMAGDSLLHGPRAE